MEELKIIPTLGLKTDVPPDDPSLFEFLTTDGSVVKTHDVGGVNVSYRRRHNTATKSEGYIQWSSSATAQATRCLGLFSIYDGTYRDYFFVDNGRVYYYNTSTFVPTAVNDTSSTVFGSDYNDLYSMIQVGAYLVFADHGEHCPHKWKHGDANLTKLEQGGGTEYKFRFLEVFRRRVIGAYSDQTNGDIEVRWSSDWPSTAITSMTFDSTNQLYVPNDDSIAGIKRLGRDKCFIYSENSIQSLDYLQNYATPFTIRTVIDGQGSVGHHNIVNLGNLHYVYNRNYGFCAFDGVNFPAGGRPISEDIEIDLQDINTEFMDLIVGTYVPLTREIVWTVPMGVAYCDTLLFYHVDSGQWRKENKAMYYVDNWLVYPDYTWNDFIAEIGGTGIWTDAGATATWANYSSQRNRLVYANTDGHLYYQYGENLNTAAIDGYRVEPAMHFGSPGYQKTIKEIWYGLTDVGNFSLHTWHRSGDTIGELLNASWTSLPDLSCNSPSRPVIHIMKSGRYHQLKWGTDGADEKFGINHIVIKYDLGSSV